MSDQDSQSDGSVIHYTQVDVLNLHLGRVARWGLIVGVVALVLCILWGIFQPLQFYQGWLVAFLFWMGISGGCLAVLMLHHLVGGAWGFVIRRPLEAAGMTLPLMAVLGIPILIGAPVLYPWAQPAAQSHAVLRHQSIAFNMPAFVIRYVVYFAAFCLIAYLLNRWSLEQDRTADADLSRKMGLLSAWGELVYIMLMSLAAIDWIMSLEPAWYSTVFGMIIIAGQGIGAFAFMLVVATLLAGRRLLSDIVRPAHIHDLGNLLLTFILLWTYCAYSQYIITWSGDIVHEISWYLHRQWGPWKWISTALIFGQFGLPFFLLLFGAIKRNLSTLVWVAGGVLLMHYVDIYWMVAPSLPPYGVVHLNPVDVLGAFAIGGLWLWDFCRRLRGRPMLPLHDPRLAGFQNLTEVIERG